MLSCAIQHEHKNRFGVKFFSIVRPLAIEAPLDNLVAGERLICPGCEKIIAANDKDIVDRWHERHHARCAPRGLAQTL